LLAAAEFFKRLEAVWPDQFLTGLSTERTSAGGPPTTSLILIMAGELGSPGGASRSQRSDDAKLPIWGGVIWIRHAASPQRISFS